MLAILAQLDVLCNVSTHARPPHGLVGSQSAFGDSLVTLMDSLQDLLFHAVWNDDSIAKGEYAIDHFHGATIFVLCPDRKDRKTMSQY